MRNSRRQFRRWASTDLNSLRFAPHVAGLGLATMPNPLFPHVGKAFSAGIHLVLARNQTRSWPGCIRDHRAIAREKKAKAALTSATIQRKRASARLSAFVTAPNPERTAASARWPATSEKDHRPEARRLGMLPQGMPKP